METISEPDAQRTNPKHLQGLEVFSEYFSGEPDTNADSMALLRDAINNLRVVGGGRIQFKRGRYDFWPDCTFEKHVYVSNNDAGLKQIAFHLEDLGPVEIDGYGAEFIFHGFVNPIVLTRCRNVLLRNFSIDFQRPFHSEGIITALGENHMEVEFSDEFPFIVTNGQLRFIGREGDSSLHEWRRLLEFDTARRETAFMAEDYWSHWFIENGLIPNDGTGNMFDQVEAVQTTSCRVRLTIPGFRATVGNTLYFGPGHRLVPGIILTDCQNVRLDDVTIHHSGGMGVVGQRSANIQLNRVNVAPKAHGKRIVSVTADATHFVNCSGMIQLKDCVFENQLDDATNIHGNYARISRILSPFLLEIETIHPQHHGFDVIRTGELIEFASSGGMVAKNQGMARSALRQDERHTLLELEHLIPEGVCVGDIVASLDTASPAVTIQGCRIGCNRARGVLLGSSGKTLVENNVFHTPGSAILFEGDGRYWFERSAVRDVTIRGNVFQTCNYGIWGRGTIEASPNIEPALRNGNACHRNIHIEGNTFQTFDDTPLLYLSCVQGVAFTGNQVEETTRYPRARLGMPRIVVDHGEDISADVI